ncbi:MAG: spore coat protein U domain-containing protein [Rhizobiaceae bacterium]|nr:spore coat protein U domain-containing protein [Rhizobiaceae bacterium]
MTAAMLFSGTTAFAADTDDMDVTLTVAADCEVTATAMDFGNLTAGGLSGATATSTISVNCATGISYQVSLDAGDGASATTTARKMTHTTVSSNTVDYGIFTDSGHTANFATATAATGTGSAVDTTAYGQISSTTAAAGDYTDTITVSLVY